MKKKLRLTYVLGLAARWVAHEWLAKYIDRSKFEVDFIILDNKDPLQDFLKENNVAYQIIPLVDYAHTSELVKRIYDHLKANKTDIVHTIFFNGHITGMQAAYYADVPVRVFTRQHGGIKDKRHARSKYELIWEMATNALSVTNKGVQGMINDGIPAEKISVIPNGFDLNLFKNVSANRVEKLKTKYNIPQHKSPIIGVSARYVEWKGIKYTLDAFPEILKAYPNACLVLAGSQKHILENKEKLQSKAKKGTYGSKDTTAIRDIEDRLATFPADSFVEISFEEDLAALYKLFDVFVHVPIDKDVEAFGQSCLDAMFSKVPTVVTLSGCVYDFAVHKQHAWVVDYKNSSQIVEGVLAILGNETFKEKIVKNAFEMASTYHIARQIESLQNLYSHTYHHAKQCAVI